MARTTESTPLTVKQTKFAALVAEGKSKAAAHREVYVSQRVPDAQRRRALETANRPNVAAEIRRLTWLGFPPVDDVRGMREQSVRILSDLSREAASEEVRMKCALALYKISETTRAAADPRATGTEQDKLLASLRKLYATINTSNSDEEPDIGPAPPRYDDEPIDLKAIVVTDEPQAPEE